MDALFRHHGLKKRKVDVIRRCIRNRKSGKEMHRVWIQAIYEKEWNVCLNDDCGIRNGGVVLL